MITLENILAVLTALVGWPALVALAIDVLKYLRVVDDGTSGKWNLGLNLVGFIAVAVLTGYFPDFDIPGLDAYLLEYVKIAAYVFMIITQVFVARGAHNLYLKTRIGKKFFTYSLLSSKLYED